MRHRMIPGACCLGDFSTIGMEVSPYGASGFVNRERGVSPSGATNFAHGGKVGKAPFKGEMFRFISPLKIPLFSDKKEGCGPLF